MYPDPAGDTAADAAEEGFRQTYSFKLYLSRPVPAWAYTLLQAGFLLLVASTTLVLPAIPNGTLCDRLLNASKKRL